MDAEVDPDRVERVAKRYAVGVGFVHVALLVWGIMVHGPGWDEVGQLAAGLSHWSTGRTDFYRVNPPLVRLWATAPLAFNQLRITHTGNYQYDLGRPEFSAGTDLMKSHKRDYWRLLRIARFACLPIALLALRIVWRWSYELFGPRGACLSLTIWAFSPMVLNNAQLITPDIGAAAIGTLACYTFHWWLKQGTPRLAYLSGLLLGATLLTKFTWMILVGLWPAQWLLQRLFAARKTDRHDVTVPTTKQGSLLAIAALFTVNVGYGFEGSFERLDRYSFFSGSLTGLPREGKYNPPRGNRFVGTPLGRIPVPLPRNVLLGIDRQKVDFEWKMPSYLRGEWRDHGWWYYYLYAAAVKEPAPFLLVALLATIGTTLVPWTRRGVSAAGDLLLPGVTLFAFVSSQTGFNHHLRYVLPAFPFFAIGVGVLGSPGLNNLRRMRAVAFTLAGIGAIACVSASPHWHAYFNVFVGGSRSGPLHLLDSNVDWGQDLLLLEKWVKDHPELPLDGVHHAQLSATDARFLVDVPARDVPQGHPQVAKTSEQSSVYSWDAGPWPGRYAVSVIGIYRNDRGLEYFRELEPVARIGWTYRVYEVTREDAIRIRETLGYGPLPDL